MMACVLGYGFGWGDFFAEGRVLFSMPWGVVSLVDVYVGFLLLGGWIWFRESSRVMAVAWILLILCLGNLISCLYVLVALRQSRNDWRRFWMGTPRAA
ncbi:DUF1475 family protein [bacterium]|nr:DUF1475 family protein [bacterium]